MKQQKALKDQQISQEELRRVVALDLEIDRLKRIREEILESIYLRLKAGAAVEHGVHRAEIEHEHRGPTFVERVRVR